MDVSCDRKCQRSTQPRSFNVDVRAPMPHAPATLPLAKVRWAPVHTTGYCSAALAGTRIRQAWLEKRLPLRKRRTCRATQIQPCLNQVSQLTWRKLSATMETQVDCASSQEHGGCGRMTTALILRLALREAAKARDCLCGHQLQCAQPLSRVPVLREHRLAEISCSASQRHLGRRGQHHQGAKYCLWHAISSSSNATFARRHLVRKSILVVFKIIVGQSRFYSKFCAENTLYEHALGWRDANIQSVLSLELRL